MEDKKLQEYLTLNGLNHEFAEISTEQARNLKALGVPEADAPTEYGGGPVFSGRSFFRWWDDPLIIHT